MDFKKTSFLKFILLLFLLFGSAKIGNSQTDEANGKIVAFHPSVGNAIVLSEKKEFDLFPEYTDSLFQSAELVKYTNGDYKVLVKTTNGQFFEKPISIAELDAIYNKIEKVHPANVVTIDSLQDDYVQEKYNSKEKEAKKRRAETANIIGEVTLTILYIALQFLSNSY